MDPAVAFLLTVLNFGSFTVAFFPIIDKSLLLFWISISQINTYYTKYYLVHINYLIHTDPPVLFHSLNHKMDILWNILENTNNMLEHCHIRLLNLVLHFRQCYLHMYMVLEVSVGPMVVGDLFCYISKKLFTIYPILINEFIIYQK